MQSKHDGDNDKLSKEEISPSLHIVDVLVLVMSLMLTKPGDASEFTLL